SAVSQQESVVDLLATLAVALAPMRREDLAAVNPSLKKTWSKDPFAEGLKNVRRTVAGSDAAGYWIAHPRFRDYMQRFKEELDLRRQKLVDHCRKWAQNPSEYAMLCAVRHFAAEGLNDVVFTTLFDPAFRTTQRAVLKSAQPTLADLRRGIEI